MFLTSGEIEIAIPQNPRGDEIDDDEILDPLSQELTDLIKLRLLELWTELHTIALKKHSVYAPATIRMNGEDIHGD